MKSTTHLFLAAGILITQAIHAQDTLNPTNPDTIYTESEEYPYFYGGNELLRDFINKNLVYPYTERDCDIQGKVLLQFVITKDGSVTDVKVIRSVSSGMDKEAVRVISMLPKFIPGRVNGKPVNVYYNIPVVFRLQ